MSDYIIEHGVPFPQRGKYPFDKMQPGDSFCVPRDKAKSAAHIAWTHNRKGDRKYSCRRMGDSVRIWRIR